MDSHSWVLWIGVIAAGAHILEEHAEGWIYWANQEVGPRLGIQIEDSDFYWGATWLLFSTIAAAAIGWWAPAVSLSIAALFLINAIFFHMLPSARGGRLTPGTLSAVFIYLPVGAWMYAAAADDGVLSFGNVVLSIVIGAALVAYPVGVILLRQKIGWQPREDADEQPTRPPQ